MRYLSCTCQWDVMLRCEVIGHWEGEIGKSLFNRRNISEHRKEMIRYQFMCWQVGSRHCDLLTMCRFLYLLLWLEMWKDSKREQEKGETFCIPSCSVDRSKSIIINTVPPAWQRQSICHWAHHNICLPHERSGSCCRKKRVRCVAKTIH